MLQVRVYVSLRKQPSFFAPGSSGVLAKHQSGWKSFSAVFERLALNSESSSAVTLSLHTDWMIVKNVSNQGGETTWLLLLGTRNPSRGCWLLRRLHFSKLAVSTWIFNGSSIKCHEKKNQPFSLFGVRFGSQAIQISGWKSAWRWGGRNEVFTRLLLIMCST